MISITQRLQSIAHDHPSKVALLDAASPHPKNSYSFKEVWLGSNLIAADLIQKGVGKSDRVLMMIKPSFEFVATVFALFQIGALPVFVDPGMPKKLLWKTLQNCKADILIGIPTVVLLFKMRILPQSNLRLKISSQQISRLIRHSMAQKLGPLVPLQQVKLNEPAAILYTSGGTGLPKGVIYTQGIFLQQVGALESAFNFKAGQIELAGFPLFSMLTLLLGMKSVLPPMNTSKPAKAPAKKLIKAILSHQVETISGSPAIWLRVTETAIKEDIQLTCVKQVLMFGAPIRESWLKSCAKVFPNAKIYTPYGATECLPVALIDHLTLLSKFEGSANKGKGTCIGLPVPGTHIKIIQPLPNTQTPKWAEVDELKPFEVGEILVHSTCVTPGYADNLSATKYSKIYDPQNKNWHRMGDMGYKDQDGYLWFCGRVSHALGHLYPIMSEGIFQKHPEVKRAALINLSKQAQRQVPAIAIELKRSFYLPGMKAKILQELNSIRQSTLSLKSIQKIHICKSMPVDGRHNIKIDRIRLGKELSR